jgi:hypothetical protein
MRLAARPKLVDSPRFSASPSPPGMQSFVSRPDLTPPQVSIQRAPGYGQQLIPSYILLSPDPISAPGSAGAMILDTNGELVWWSPVGAGVTSEGIPFNLRVQSYGGQPVLTYWQGTVEAGHGYGHYVLLDDTYKVVRRVYAGNELSGDLHEFLITPYGSALITCYYRPKVDSARYHGVAQEIDIATGAVRFQWQTLYQVSPSESYSGGADFFHINSVDLWPTPAGSYRQDLIVSGRNVWAAYRISRDTPGGRIIWKLGGTRTKQNIFQYAPGTGFAWQHDVRALADRTGVSIFDDAIGPPSKETQARGMVLNVNMTTRQVTPRHYYYHYTTPGGLQVPYEGNVQLLPNGGHFVGWGGVPWFSEFGPSGSTVNGTIVLDGQLPASYSSYRAYLTSWVGNPPESELALKVLPGPSSGQYVAFMSWNGSTQVAYWHLVAGPSSDSTLPEVAVLPREGFETHALVSVAGSPSSLDFRAYAIGQQGQVLGSSARVAPSA